MNDLVLAAIRAAEHGDNALALIRIMRSQRFAITLTSRKLFEGEDDLRHEVRVAVRYARVALKQEAA